MGTRLRRKYRLHEETGIVFIPWRDLNPVLPQTNRNVWLDQGDHHTLWLVNFDAQPASHRVTDASQSVDGWELNSGRWLIFIEDGTLRVTNEISTYHTSRFTVQASGAAFPLSVNEVTGELQHG